MLEIVWNAIKLLELSTNSNISSKLKIFARGKFAYGFSLGNFEGSPDKMENNGENWWKHWNNGKCCKMLGILTNTWGMFSIDSSSLSICKLDGWKGAKVSGLNNGVNVNYWMIYWCFMIGIIIVRFSFFKGRICRLKLCGVFKFIKEWLIIFIFLCKNL